YKKKYGNGGTITPIFKKPSDDDMLKIICDEKRGGGGTSSAAHQETNRAAVEGDAPGGSNLPAPGQNGHVRYAPSFRKGKFNESKLTHPYTAESLAEYFHWTVGKDKQVSPRLRNALRVLEEAEQTAIDANDPTFQQKLEALTDGLRSN